MSFGEPWGLVLLSSYAAWLFTLNGGTNKSDRDSQEDPWERFWEPVILSRLPLSFGKKAVVSAACRSHRQVHNWQEWIYSPRSDASIGCSLDMWFHDETNPVSKNWDFSSCSELTSPNSYSHKEQQQQQRNNGNSYSSSNDPLVVARKLICYQDHDFWSIKLVGLLTLTLASKMKCGQVTLYFSMK